MSQVTVSSVRKVVRIGERQYRVITVGIPGPAGGGGGGGTIFEHVQNSAAATWIINHNLGYFPDIHVYTLGGSEIIAEVQHVSPNQARVYLAAPMTGRARCV